MFHAKAFFLLLPLILAATLQAESTQEERIEALIKIHDPGQAVAEAQQLLKSKPDNSDSWELYLAALADQNNEEQMLAIWKSYHRRFPDFIPNSKLMEKIAWGIIQKAARSPQPVVRLYAGLAAAFVNHSYSVPILIKMLQDPQAELRAAAANLASHFRDVSIQKAIPEALLKETHPSVREELVRSMSGVDGDKSEKILKQIIASPDRLAEEKTAAVVALLHRKDLESDEIEQLVKSERAGLRGFACLIAVQNLAHAHLSLLFPLLQDPCASVRAAAVYAISLLHDQDDPSVEEVLEKAITDADPRVSIFASQALTLRGRERGRHGIEKWLQSDRLDIRRQASAALATTGAAGIELMQKTLRQNPDPFVRANVAIGLISQRSDLNEAAQVLFAFLDQIDFTIGWKGDEIIPYLTENKRSSSLLGLSFPEIKSLQIKLQLLKMLSIADAGRTEAYMRKFLRHHSREISSSAASLLLFDSNPDTFNVVEQLLKDSDPRIRIEAALICALFGHEEKSLPILEEAYEESDREMKGKILEGIAQISSEQSIPFLIEACGESSQILRVIAAAGLLKIL